MKKLLLVVLLSTILQTTAQAGEILTTDVVDTAANAGTFKTLVVAIKVAKLENLLRGTGPFTVFAPTDAAFAKLPSGALEKLLQNPAALRKLILGHVVIGKELSLSSISSAAVFTGGFRSSPFLEMASGQYESLSCAASFNCIPNISDSMYVANDIQAANGIIQVVDAILSPLDIVIQ